MKLRSAGRARAGEPRPLEPYSYDQTKGAIRRIVFAAVVGAISLAVPLLGMYWLLSTFVGDQQQAVLVVVVLGVIMVPILAFGVYGATVREFQGEEAAERYLKRFTGFTENPRFWVLLLMPMLFPVFALIFSTVGTLVVSLFSALLKPPSGVTRTLEMLSLLVALICSFGACRYLWSLTKESEQVENGSN